MKRFLSFFVFAVLFGGYAMADDYDFSSVCESGQTLYYYIISKHYILSSVEPYTVEVIHNSSYNDNITGDLVIPSSVVYNNETYSVTSIGDQAFYSCTGLTSVTIGNSVTSIGYAAFSSCTGLTSVTIPNSVTNIGDFAFSNCIGLSEPVYNAHCFAYFPCGYATEYVIPDGIQQIAGGAFHGGPSGWGCGNLTTIVIPNSVNSIGREAFSETGWYNSQPDGILYLEGWCVGHKGNAPEGPLNIAEGTRGIADYAFYECSELTSVIIPNFVTNIGEKAFSRCQGLISITIPNSVMSIGNYAFQSCRGLTSITIGNSVTSIGMGAFDGCSGLTSVIIPNSVTTIGDDAFRECSGLTSVTIGNSVTSIGIHAFYQCCGLTEVNYNATNCTTMGLSISDGEFVYDVISVFECHCDANATINIGSNVTTIPDGAFAGLRGNGELTIPNSVTSIGIRAFVGCTGLTSVIIPNSVTTIGNSAFSGCSGLIGELTIPNSVTSIGRGAFNRCSGLETIVVNSGNTIYDSRENCNAIIETATNTLIMGCQNTIIPNDVTKIGADAFSYCTGLTGITIPNSVTEIGNYAFNKCTGLTSIVIPNSVTTIGNWAFDECYEMTKVTIGSSVNSIGKSAFGECYSLDTIYSLAVNPPVMQNFAFGREDEPIYEIPVFVPCGRVSFYSNAEYWNEFTNIRQNPDCAGVEENEIADLELYPNSVGNTLYINAEEPISEIEIVNVMGQVVRRIEVNSDNAVSDVEDLTSGVYVVRIYSRPFGSAQGAALRKFVKE